MEIKIDIQDERTLHFLKMFAENHYSGADDNVWTCQPIHLVQSREYQYVPYDCELVDDYGGWEICFMNEYGGEVYDNEIDFIKENFYLDELEIEEKDLKSYDELYRDSNLSICDYEDYFLHYGVSTEDYRVLCKKGYWATKAYFLIREEAKRYKEYQKHNLGESRIYTDSHGYSNYGEWTKFYDLLLEIGNEVKGGLQINDK